MELPTRRRVKLYALNEEGQWDDKGTGHITCQFSSDHDGFAICLHSEADNELLLEHKVSMQPIYANQNQTIITWTDPESTTDYALSFQEHTGCSDMWAQICNVQGRSVDHEETAQPGEGAHDGADRARRGEHGGGDRAASESVLYALRGGLLIRVVCFRNAASSVLIVVLTLDLLINNNHM